MIPFLKTVSPILDHPSQRNSSSPTATVALFPRFFIAKRCAWEETWFDVV